MEGVHANHDMSCVMSLSYPSESIAPGLQNLPEDPVYGESKGAFYQKATLGSSDQDRGELFKESIEVTSSESEVVHGKRDEAFSCVELNRPSLVTPRFLKCCLNVA
jgi:hypothetical protein